MSYNILQSLPSVEVLVNHEKNEKLVALYGRETIVKATRVVLDEIRAAYRRKETDDFPDEENVLVWIVGRVSAYVENRYTSTLVNSINATGVVLHTGLGRAVLSDTAIANLTDVARYCTLATDRFSGRRGHRDDHLNGLICEITGAEAATVVNNNSAATMLILNTLAKDKEVILSRGQLVEIGGAFRMPDVMETSGCTLREVGTTNKTHLRDYENAICEETGAIMRVHHSNYRIMGFSSEPEIGELAELSHKHNLPIIDDIGSGALVDLSEFGVESEPLIKDSIACGSDVICFSGDKLVGGPQAGIIVGSAEVVKRIKKNPLSRAFRVGKLTIAALEATLKLFLSPERLTEVHPVYRMFGANKTQLTRRARKMLRELNAKTETDIELKVVDGHSQIGSGSVPVETLPSKLLSIRSETPSVHDLAICLRANDPPIFPRVHKEALLLDFRTIHPSDDKTVTEAVVSIINRKGRKKNK